MSDYFDQVERGLREAVRRRAHQPWYTRLRGRRPRALAIALACIVVGGPAIAAATGVFGFSNQGVAFPKGVPVQIPQSEGGGMTMVPPGLSPSERRRIARRAGNLGAALKAGIVATYGVGGAVGGPLRSFGTLDGFHFVGFALSGGPQYSTVTSGFSPGKQFCYGVTSAATAASGCVWRGFPSAEKPVVVADPGNGTFVGFAANGIASVKLLNAAGATLARATVHHNLFAADYRRVRGWLVPKLMAADPHALLHLTVEALDGSGDVIARTPAAGARDWSQSYPAPPG
jgi:hypothetical protein